jgi:hypothetical protein
LIVLIANVVFECCICCFRMLRNSSSCCTRLDVPVGFFATVLFECYSARLDGYSTLI